MENVYKPSKSTVINNKINSKISMIHYLRMYKIFKEYY